MEQNDPSRRQYAPQAYTTQQTQQRGAPAPAQFAMPERPDRHRQSSYLQESPTSGAPAGRAGGDAQQMYGFAQGAQYGANAALQTSPVQYGQDIQGQRQQAQQYQQYGANVVYGMAQPQAAQATYEQVPQYRPRTNNASETLVTQFGVPQTAQYYLAGQPGHASASAAELSTPQIPSQYQQTETYPQPGPSPAQAYPSNLMDPSQSGAFTTYVQQPQYAAHQQAAPIDQGFDQYQSQIRTIFTLARDGALRDSASRLLDVSQYLIGNSEALGLTRDDETQHDDRIRLWDEFNRAWLVTLQRQFDLTQEMLQANQPLREPRSILSSQALERLAQELVRLCDSVEKHGLVDYQIGVAEEDIMDLLIRCLSLLDPNSERTAEGRAPAESSVAGIARGR